jgi:hypothetical protein
MLSATVVTPIAIVTSPTAHCRPLLVQVSRRAECASGTAVTIKNARMPLIEAIPLDCKPVTPPALSAPFGPAGQFGEPPLAQSGEVAEVEVKGVWISRFV